jgi:hypothetical protein
MSHNGLGDLFGRGVIAIHRELVVAFVKRNALIVYISEAL